MEGRREKKERGKVGDRGRKREREKKKIPYHLLSTHTLTPTSWLGAVSLYVGRLCVLYSFMSKVVYLSDSDSCMESEGMI